MMKWLRGSLLVLVLLMGSWVAAIEPSTNCGLAEDDCALLERSTATMATVTSGNFDFDFTMNFSDASQRFEYAFSLLGDGSYVLDADAMESLSETEGTSNTVLMNQWNILSKGVNAELNFTLKMPRDVATTLSAPTEITLPLRLVDGIGYANLDEIAELDRTINGGWYSLDLEELAPLVMLAMAGQTQPTEFEDTQAFNEYVTLTREADVTIADTEAAVFMTVIDLEAFMQDPQFVMAMQEAMEASLRQQGIRDTDEFIDAYLLFIGAFDVQFTQTIGIEDAYLYHAAMEMVFAPTKEEMRALGRSEIFAGIQNSIGGMTFTFEFNMWDHNEASEVDAPRNAEPVNLNDLLRGLQ